MAVLLLVPVHLDALVLRGGESIVESMADFTRMQFADGSRDVNPDTACVSEELLSAPFQNRNLTLKPGTHLHWSLPDVLTRGQHMDGKTTYPPVPDRWLITRTGDGQTKQWVVESDYLFPPGIAPDQPDANGCVPWDSVSFPFQDAKHPQPFRYLGRTLTLEQWLKLDKDSPPPEYLRDSSQPLTVPGYGEPAFAAFYPNCHSVFGFHDDDTAPSDGRQYQYEVLGWYSGGDVIGWLDKTLRRLGVISPNTANMQISEREVSSAIVAEKDRPTALDLDFSKLDDGFKWIVSDVSIKPSESSDKPYPLQIACYARLTVSGQSSDQVKKVTSIAVGNTGLEALSAYLAATIDNDHKSIIEDQLEALHLSSRLEHQQLDIGYKFQEARHERSFVGTSGGSMWTIRQKGQDDQSADKADKSANARDAAARAQITLPVELADRLNELNRLQQESNRAIAELESLRRLLFGDWYKYMLCAYPPEDSRDDYPDIDEVKNFLDTQDIPAIKAQVQLCTTNKNALDSKVAEIKVGLPNSYILMETTAPPYWRPREPVVLITGDLAQPTNRHGQDGRLRDDGLLECHLMQDVDLNADAKAGFKRVRRELDSPSQKSGIGFSTSNGRPWNPILLEWEVELLPAELSGNLASDSRSYSPDFISGNYALPDSKCDLQTLGKSTVRGANIYSGRSILSPHATDLLQAQLEDFFTKAYAAEPNAKETELDKIVAALRASHGTKNSQDPIWSALQAYDKLKDLNCLSQCLGGFNDALLMHKLTMQLNVGDPLAFDDYARFAAEVKTAVGQSIISAPQPLSDFNPIRSGEMKLLQLRLVDTFGQINDIALDNIVASDTLAVGSRSNSIALPPRIVQPARLNFRWLAADDDHQEMNDHPATTPVCGWVLPNNLDGNLMIYDGGGAALGSIDQTATWRAPPGSDVAPPIKNSHLQNFVTYLTTNNKGDSLLSDFLSAIDNALENIDPEGFAQHEARGLLMGRPMALVRAAIDLEIEGLPAVHQGWHVFRQDLNRTTRQTDSFTRVRFPVRVGEYKQFNDGLVGYWIESGNGYQGDLFYTPGSNAGVQNAKIKTHSKDPLDLWVALDDAPVHLSMLVDPRGQIHATTGILPTQAVQIPPDQFAVALKKIEITFLSTPILTDSGKINPTDRGQVNLPLPAEPGFAWSWVEKYPGDIGWMEASEIGRANPQAAFAAPQEIREGWLKLRPVAEQTQNPRETKS